MIANIIKKEEGFFIKKEDISEERNGFVYLKGVYEGRCSVYTIGETEIYIIEFNDKSFIFDYDGLMDWMFKNQVRIENEDRTLMTF